MVRVELANAQSQCQLSKDSYKGEIKFKGQEIKAKIKDRGTWKYKHRLFGVRWGMDANGMTLINTMNYASAVFNRIKISIQNIGFKVYGTT